MEFEEEEKTSRWTFTTLSRVLGELTWANVSKTIVDAAIVNKLNVADDQIEENANKLLVTHRMWIWIWLRV